MDEGRFADELVPIEVPHAPDTPRLVIEDEEPRRVDFDKIPTLRPAFEEGGTVTAANASSISDGAAAVVLAADDVARRRGCETAGKAGRPGRGGAGSGVVYHRACPSHQAITREDRLEGRGRGFVRDQRGIRCRRHWRLPQPRDLVRSCERSWGRGGAGPSRRLQRRPNSDHVTLRDDAPQCRRGVAAVCLAGGEAAAVAVEHV